MMVAAAISLVKAIETAGANTREGEPTAYTNAGEPIHPTMRGRSAHMAFCAAEHGACMYCDALLLPPSHDWAHGKQKLAPVSL
jgi:hypothetical protein